MKNKSYSRAFLPVLAVFLLVSVCILSATSLLRRWNADGGVLLGGNGLLFALTAVSYFLHLRSLNHPNPHFFVRMVYSSLLIKMLVCLIAVGVYAWFATTVNKAGILGSFILYVVYTFLEVRLLIKFLKKSPNNVQT